MLRSQRLPRVTVHACAKLRPLRHTMQTHSRHALQPQICRTAGSKAMHSRHALQLDSRQHPPPRMMRHCRARLRPLRSQLRELLFSVGTTSVTMGMVGRYLAIRLAVRPELAYTMIKPACRVRAGGIYRRQHTWQAAVALKPG